jgi:hypothetical protein
MHANIDCSLHKTMTGSRFDLSIVDWTTKRRLEARKEIPPPQHAVSCHRYLLNLFLLLRASESLSMVRPFSLWVRMVTNGLRTRTSHRETQASDRGSLPINRTNWLMAEEPKSRLESNQLRMHMHSLSLSSEEASNHLYINSREVEGPIDLLRIFPFGFNFAGI